jgi:hypothetical protein
MQLSFGSEIGSSVGSTTTIDRFDDPGPPLERAFVVVVHLA